MWGATTPKNINSYETCSFNPRTRVGCDGLIIHYIGQASVSIHAPVWGATLSIKHGLKPVSFNPRTRVGCDQYLNPFFNPFLVSIHAPVWGATSSGSIMFKKTLFQSTHPCGVRPKYKPCFGHTACFNPRTRVGCDPHHRCKALRLQVSIHAPVWGATQQQWTRKPSQCFNPRTRVGCDSRMVGSKPAANCFNPRTRVGCDFNRFLPSSNFRRFNPRTRVGCDNRLIQH